MTVLKEAFKTAVCPICNETFSYIRKSKVACSYKCSHKRWKNRNMDHYREYDRKYKKAHYDDKQKAYQKAYRENKLKGDT